MPRYATEGLRSVIVNCSGKKCFVFSMKSSGPILELGQIVAVRPYLYFAKHSALPVNLKTSPPIHLWSVDESAQRLFATERTADQTLDIGDWDESGDLPVCASALRFFGAVNRR